jgi:hypothetical protein
VSRTSVFPLTLAEQNSDVMIEQKKSTPSQLRNGLAKEYVIIDGDDTEEATPQNEM